MNAESKINSLLLTSIAVFALLLIATPSHARDITYKGGEVSVYVNPGEPTQIHFPGEISGGYKKKQSSLSLDKQKEDLVIFATDTLANTGEAIIVRLQDGDSFSVRVRRADENNPRDSLVKVEKDLAAMYAEESSDTPPYARKGFAPTSPHSVMGLMREMVLNSEFGKENVLGYRVSEQHKGEVVLTDGAVEAKIDRIFIGPRFWGYVIDTSNKLNQTQLINPATFRLDGTRAVSSERWELAPLPLNIEEQISGAHKTKVYVVTKARKG